MLSRTMERGKQNKDHEEIALARTETIEAKAMAAASTLKAEECVKKVEKDNNSDGITREYDSLPKRYKLHEKGNDK